MIFLRSFNGTFETAVEYYLAADKNVARRCQFAGKTSQRFAGENQPPLR